MPHSTRLPTGAEFDPERARRVTGFFEDGLVHTKGIWARKKFTLAGWERDDILSPLFGRVRYDDHWKRQVRQYNLAWIEVARKNGKSELLAGIALYMLLGDQEEAAEVYGAASDRDQASMVYRVAKRMCELSPALSREIEKKRLVIIDSRKRIVWTKTDSFYQVVSADAAGNLGSNPSGVVFDEVLTQPNRDLWDAFRQGEGTRTQMLMVAATTAGNDPRSFCYTEHEFGLQVAENPDLDPGRFVYIRSVPMDADWKDEANWALGNPALGATEDGGFLNINTLRREFTEVVNKGDLAAQANFRQFRCNQWQRQANRWLDMSVWDENHQSCGPFEEASLVGVRGYAGLDLAETDDFTAWVMIFEKDGVTYVVPRFWIPSDSIEKKHKKIKEYLYAWEAQGILKVTPGAVVDYATIIEDILADLETFHIEEVGFDPWNATAVVQAIESRTNTVCVKIPQTTLRMNAGSKELTRILGRREFATGGNPILRWQADNVEAQRDSDGNIKPSKSHSPEKIDGIVALVNALSVRIREHEEDFETTMFAFIPCPDCNADLEVIDEDLDLYGCPECPWKGRLT